MNILVDMNLSPSWADFLTGAGFTSVHWSNEGAPDASDRHIMEWAAGNDFVILTADFDSCAIPAASRGRSPSVITLQSGNLDLESVGGAVLAAIRHAQLGLRAGAIMSVDADTDGIQLAPLPGR